MLNSFMSKIGGLLPSQAEKPIAEGLSATQWVALVNSDRAKWAMKALNYLDGLQLEELMKTMDECRKEWKSRGFIPRTRNLTKAIIEKSSQLFACDAPKLEIWRDAEEADAEQTQRLMDELNKVDWVEVFNNVDQVVRLLKTAILLVQWDKQYGVLTFDVLHRGNCEVVLNPATRKISSLIHRTGQSYGTTSYRIWTAEEVIDISQDEKEITISNREPNTLGFVPAAVFYDTAPPRSGFWVEAPHDLIGLNEIVNLHITDSEWASSYAKRPMPVTNMRVAGGDSSVEIAETQPFGQKLPRIASAGPDITSGPDTVVFLKSTGVDNPFFRFEAPAPDLKSLNEVVESWIHAYAADWSVRVSTAGQASASSGFQLVVEELPNLELRKKRAKQMEAGFRRLFAVIAGVVNAGKNLVWFDPEAALFADFSEPSLPIDQKDEEEIWDKKIAGNRASVIDYLMKKEELSRDEAVTRFQEIAAFNAAQKAPPKSDEPAQD